MRALTILRSVRDAVFLLLVSRKWRKLVENAEKDGGKTLGKYQLESLNI